MKYILIVLFIHSIATHGISQDASDIVSFDSEALDLGIVKKGDLIEGAYTFKNISSEPVQIELVSTCECTEAKWTTKKIKPGETGTISFVFDSSKKEKEETIDVDIYFVNVNPKTGNPYSAFLTYEFKFDL